MATAEVSFLIGADGYAGSDGRRAAVPTVGGPAGVAILMPKLPLVSGPEATITNEVSQPGTLFPVMVMVLPNGKICESSCSEVR